MEGKKQPRGEAGNTPSDVIIDNHARILNALEKWQGRVDAFVDVVSSGELLLMDRIGLKVQ